LSLVGMSDGLPSHSSTRLSIVLTFWMKGILKLTRFRGHPNVGIFGVHDGKEAGTVCAGVPPADD
jgi:hypothetical protein